MSQSPKDQPLDGKKILLGITGGIAAYKSAELLRLLVKAGAEVRVVMTGSATKFIAPLTFHTLSGHPVVTTLFSEDLDGGIDHITLTDWANLFIIAPATANCIGKLAGGMGDDALSTMAIAFDGDFLIAPAMNSKMYRNEIVQDNLDKLKTLGFNFIGPESGDLACGYEDMGRMSEPDAISKEVVSIIGKGDLSGKTILVTAGPTREEIDPVRFISNRSSGKMGYAVAREAVRRGAKVTLISGPTAIEPPKGAEIIQVTTAEEMKKAVMKKAKGMDAVIMAAAVADYKPSKVSSKKIKKKEAKASLELEKTDDILAELGKKKKGALLVGFAAETDNLVKHAEKKLKEKNLDLIVANDVTEKGAGFDVETNRVTLIDKKGIVKKTKALPKSEIAGIILETVKEKLT